MGFSSFMLADSARLSEGLIYALGAGINSLARTTYPAAMQCSLVGIIDLPDDYAGEQVNFTITVLSEDRTDVFAKLEAAIASELKPGAPSRGNTVPVVLDLTAVLLPRSDVFIIEGQVEDEAPQQIMFTVVTIAEDGSLLPLPDHA